MTYSKQYQRRNQILDAAMKVLIQSGYERARMDDIVRTANLSKGAIYWYYKSKKDIYLDLVNYWVQHYSVMINHIVEDTSPASVQLRRLFNYFIDQYEADPDPFKALTEFWSLSQMDPDFKHKLERVYTSFLEIIEQIVKLGIENKEFKQLDPHVTALSIMVNIESINWFTLFRAHGVSAREYFQTITDFILAGLLKKH